MRTMPPNATQRPRRKAPRWEQQPQLELPRPVADERELLPWEDRAKQGDEPERGVAVVDFFI
mgnify:FL=1